MRVIAGRSKGRLLKIRERKHVRPTASKVKEALFAILADQITGARVLDLFAGTGAVGIEALSRGADSVDLVEQDPVSLRVLEENLKRCGFASRAKIHRGNVFRFLRQTNSSTRPFEIVFLDPPYHAKSLKNLLPLLSRGAMITKSGNIIIEHFHKVTLPDQIGHLRRFRFQRYGDTILSFYEKT